MTNSNIQINSKYQTSNVQDAFEFWSLEIGDYLGFGAWDLEIK
jgi:hypothetical protein